MSDEERSLKMLLHKTALSFERTKNPESIIVNRMNGEQCIDV